MVDDWYRSTITCMIEKKKNSPHTAQHKSPALILFVLLKHVLPGFDLLIIFLFIFRMILAKLHNRTTVTIPFSRFIPTDKFFALVVTTITQALWVRAL